MTPRTQYGHKESGACGFLSIGFPRSQEVPFIKKSVFLCWLDKAIGYRWPKDPAEPLSAAFIIPALDWEVLAG